MTTPTTVFWIVAALAWIVVQAFTGDTACAACALACIILANQSKENR